MNKAIFYLEDDDALAFVTSRSLRSRGFQVSHFSSLASATNGLEKGEFDYALLDLKIGTETSMELIKGIIEKKPIPLVVVTGYGTIRTAVQAMKLGAVDFLTKPFDMNELVTLLQQPRCSDQNLSHEISVEKPSLKSIEREAIQKALDDNQGNISAAAKQLKMHRRTLQRKLSKKSPSNI